MSPPSKKKKAGPPPARGSAIWDTLIDELVSDPVPEAAPTTVRRKHYFAEWITDSYGYKRSGPRSSCREDDANLVGSALKNADGFHAPVLDIDYDAQLLPSKTPGHYHLYLDKPIAWGAYRRVLEVLAGAGLIEEGYADASIAERESFLRVPAGGDSLELRMAQRAFRAEKKVRELEDEIAGLRELIVELMGKMA